MADVKFRRGLLSELPQTRVDGTIYITTDEGGMYVDTPTKRVRLGDFIPVNTVSDLPQNGHAYETAVYYVKEGNILARWDADGANNGANPRWIQINKAGVVQVTNDPNNPQNANVVTGISITTNAQGQLSLVVTKTSVATSDDLSDLEAIVSGHTTALSVLNGDANTTGSVAKAVSDARNALLGSPTTYTTIEALETALLAVKTTADGAAAQAATNASNITDLQDDLGDLTSDVSDNSAAIATLNGDANTSGSVAHAVAAEAALRDAADDALSDRIDALGTRVGTAEGNISDNADAIAAIETRLGTGSSSLESRVAANESAISTLNGGSNVNGSVQSTVNSRIAEVIADAPEAFDTLKEIADWIGENSDDALTMQQNIEDNADAISALQTRMTTAEGNITTNASGIATNAGNITNNANAISTLNGDSNTVGSVDYKIAQAISSVNDDISDVADDLSDLASRVTTNEGNISTIMGDANTTGSIAQQVAAEALARGNADTALQTQITTNATDIAALESDVSDLQDDVADIQSALTWKNFTD